MSAARTLPELLNQQEVAELLHTTERHIRRLVAERRIPYVKVGRLVRFVPSDVAEWIEDCSVGALR